MGLESYHDANLDRKGGGWMSTEDSVELVGLLDALYARAMPRGVRLSWSGHLFHFVPGIVCR